MEKMSVKRAAQLCGGRIIGKCTEDAQIARVIIDSRAVEPGDMFAAYRGERADGHDYIPAAFAKGAACCLAERAPETAQGPVILADDVQRALESIVSAYRESLNLPVVGITGSVGKTTAKEMVWWVLSQKLNVLKTEGNLITR